MDPRPIDILKQYWQHDAFRPLQEEIIGAVLDGKDALALLPTGGGKSLCFQVPALMRPGLCLVVSPLISLMKDQVDQLRKKNITAFAIWSGMSRKEVINTLQVTVDSNCKFLYVSPERLGTRLFAEWLPSLPVGLIAVDEAHCVSQWGYDFRPSYLKIAQLREELPGVPLLALTASATREALEDIEDKLALRQPALFRGPFTRPALSYSAFKVESKTDKILEILQGVPGSSIVYCKTRKAAEETGAVLARQGIAAGVYHAGLPQDERMQRQEDWIKDRLRVMVCTNAFGMGIDKPDVRTVIHAGVPEAIENYYQEAGRAGRDGRKAYAVLLYGAQEPADADLLADARYPSPEKVRGVYQHLLNYLQIPAGTGEGNYYDFDPGLFADRLKLDSREVTGALRTLEQEGLLSIQQRAFLPSQLRFTTGKQALYEFEKAHPELGPLIDHLLRSYEGIFDQPASIYERQLAWTLRRDRQEVVGELLRLQAFHIVDYSPQKEGPQLFFLRDRPYAEELYIDPLNHKSRKEQYAARLRAMVTYLEGAGECRSRFLAGYFGDTTARDCGICDNCLKRSC